MNTIPRLLLVLGILVVSGGPAWSDKVPWHRVNVYSCEPWYDIGNGGPNVISGPHFTYEFDTGQYCPVYSCVRRGKCVGKFVESIPYEVIENGCQVAKCTGLTFSRFSKFRWGREGGRPIK